MRPQHQKIRVGDLDVHYEVVDHTAPWRGTPPGVEPDEQRLPRSGVHFATAGALVPGDATASGDSALRR